jgi:hypothetical protein
MNHFNVNDIGNHDAYTPAGAFNKPLPIYYEPDEASMSPKSRKAFEAWMENEAKVIGISNVGISLPWHVAFTPEERSTFKRLWTVAEAYGREQALEEALKATT